MMLENNDLLDEIKKNIKELKKERKKKKKVRKFHPPTVNMLRLKCSLCGWEDNRKKPYPYEELNEHFLHAKQIWCPRNVCKEKYGRKVPKGCIEFCCYDYGGWTAVEERSNIIDLEDAKSVLSAKQILEAGLEILRSQGKIE